MTRKCVICKESNYKNSCSFFSAPKDTDTRKKWKDAIGIDNYVVSDETFVCSKHFTPIDIITHWVSGVPPHVVTIKYKKCRLRPGAVPNTSSESTNNLPNTQDDEDEFALNRGSGVAGKPLEGGHGAGKTVFIPREENFPLNSDVESNVDQVGYETHAMVECKIENEYMLPDTANEEFSEDTNDSAIMENPNHEHEMATIVNVRANAKFVYTANEEESHIAYIEGLTSENPDCTEEETELPSRKTVETETVHSSVKIRVSSGEEENSMDLWDSLSNENAATNDPEVRENLNRSNNSRDGDDVNTDRTDRIKIKMENDSDDTGMLFEDLLDIYTEVQLPRGWSSMVTSRGHGTTVVYAYMGMTRSGMPYIEKQVFLKSDMRLRCGAANIELCPQMHNLVREGRSDTVYVLADVEEFVEEFDHRVVCEGCAGEKTRPEDIDNSVAYKDVSSKWRHIQCPIIVNNGSSRCSKCSTLDTSLTRSRVRRHNAEVQEFAKALMKKEKTIRVLHRLLRKMNKRNQRFESMRESIEGKFATLVSESHQLFMSTVESLTIPKIQKLMIRECVRASAPKTGKSKYSETWVFLCLLLYIESPRMYKYMLLNKYMILPSLRIIRRYLHQIKTDKQFYNHFQRTVEPFQPCEKESEKEPT